MWGHLLISFLERDPFGLLLLVNLGGAAVPPDLSCCLLSSVTYFVSIAFLLMYCLGMFSVTTLFGVGAIALERPVEGSSVSGSKV